MFVTTDALLSPDVDVPSSRIVVGELKVSHLVASVPVVMM